MARRQPGLPAALLLAAALAAGMQGPALAQSGEIEIRGRAATTDGYLCWTPVRARVRLLGNPAQDATIVLKSAPLGQAAGDVAFLRGGKPSIGRAEYAPLKELELVLPRDGSWVDFFIAGTRASVGAKDVIVRAELKAGGTLTQAPVMVRVRKDAESLTPAERDALLKALWAWKAKPGLSRPTRFEDYYTAHNDAFNLGIHSQFGSAVSNFLPWHRAFLLNLERELQQIDPAVALPYWKFDAAAPRLFTLEFLGSLQAGSSEVRFSPSNPIGNWTLSSGERLSRGRDWASGAPVGAGNLPALTCAPGSPNCNALNDVYRHVTDSIEINYHNFAHGSTGGWLGRGTSPMDPLFFLLHANTDRGWARWQESRQRFNGSGQDATSYTPVGRYPGTAAPQRAREGVYALDPMWPWRTTPGGPGTPDPMDDWPPYRFPFPAVPGLPFAPASPPTPASMVDYLGLSDNGSAHGACYDDQDFLGRDPRKN